MRKRKIFATGSIVTTMLFTGATRSFAHTVPTSKVSGQSKNIYVEYSRNLIVDDGRGVDPKAEDMSRQELLVQGFSPAQVHKILGYERETYKIAKNIVFKD